MAVASEFVWLFEPQPFYGLCVSLLDAVLGKSESQMAWLSCSHVGIASLYSMIQQTVVVQKHCAVHAGIGIVVGVDLKKLSFGGNGLN